MRKLPRQEGRKLLRPRLNTRTQIIKTLGAPAVHSRDNFTEIIAEIPTRRPQTGHPRRKNSYRKMEISSRGHKQTIHARKKNCHWINAAPDEEIQVYHPRRKNAYRNNRNLVRGAQTVNPRRKNACCIRNTQPGDTHGPSRIPEKSQSTFKTPTGGHIHIYGPSPGGKCLLNYGNPKPGVTNKLFLDRHRRDACSIVGAKNMTPVR